MLELSIKDLIEKREECIERAKPKYIGIGSKFLGGSLKFHSLTKGDLADARERLKMDQEKGLLYFIYLSADDLRDKELLKAYNCDKKESFRIVERLFNEAERARIIGILEEINGLNSINSDEIYKVELDDLKN